jgi:hypothetical protein
MSRLVIILATLALGGVAAGCGDSGEEESANGDCPPALATIATAPTLPAGFPTPSGVVYTAAEATGPSTVVHGYLPAAIQGAYDAYKGAFSAPFTVTKSEKDAFDAEVAFGGTVGTGQVKMVQQCKDRTTLTITIRPV